MDRDTYADADYRQPTGPPATPPAIDPNADAEDAAAYALDDRDGNAPGSQPAHFNRTREDEALFEGGSANSAAEGGDEDLPGQQPDEIVPDEAPMDAPEEGPADVLPDEAPDESAPPAE